MSERSPNIIVLLTDFGLKGRHYVAIMKGVILKINPLVKIIDLSHDITPFSIIEASYLLKTTFKFFPEQAIFIVVVDPGVGSKRGIIAIHTHSKKIFIGPDNGIFTSIFKKDEIMECILVQNEEYFHKPVSKTFHGRDIMAPVGACITKGIKLKDLGPAINWSDLLNVPMTFKALGDNKFQCTIQFIDSFGNCITNIPIEGNVIKNTLTVLNEGTSIKMEINDKAFEGKYISHFASVPKGLLLYLEGSSNFLEISLNQASVAEKIGFKVGDVIEIEVSSGGK